MNRLPLLLVLALVACGSNAAPPPSAAPAAPAASGSAAASDHEMNHGEPAPRPPPAGQTITVTLDGHQVDVDVAKVANGGASAPIMAVWKQAFPTEDTSALQFDLVGSDGFRPTSRSQCTHLLSAKEMEAGKVDAGNHDLGWDDAAKMAHCYRVKALSRIEAKK